VLALYLGGKTGQESTWSQTHQDRATSSLRRIALVSITLLLLSDQHRRPKKVRLAYGNTGLSVRRSENSAFAESMVTGGTMAAG